MRTLLPFQFWTVITNGIISLCDGWRTDLWDVAGIWAHYVTGRYVSHSYGNAEIDNFDPTLDPNDSDKPYEAVIISISPILICSLLKYESVTHKDTMNLLG